MTGETDAAHGNDRQQSSLSVVAPRLLLRQSRSRSMRRPRSCLGPLRPRYSLRKFMVEAAEVMTVTDEVLDAMAEVFVAW